MTFKEFCKRHNEIKMKYDIIVLAELLKLYKEYGKEKYTLENTFNELHDEIVYTEEQKQYIMREAEELSQKKNDY